MSTNKTRIVVWDFQSGSSYQIVYQSEFEVYQEAIDYVETTLNNKPSNVGGIDFCVFSYDRESFLYRVDGAGTITKDEITFPELLS
jgi:hypothetical protein